MNVEKFIKTRREEPTLYYCDRDVDLRPGVRYGPVIRDIYLVECCTSGRGSVIINGREFPFEAGSCCLLCPGDTITHTADTEYPRAGVWCAIDGLQVRTAFTQAGVSADEPFAPPEAFGEILENVQRMIDMRDDEDNGADYRRTACIYAILGAILRGTASRQSDGWLKRAIGIMETQYHRRLNVDEIAKEVGLERSYFSTVFKQKCGISPHVYLNSLRIKKACVLMKEEGFSVSAAASSVGLDARNFARIFFRECGCSPLEWLRQARSEG